jgi:sugar phosphate isomerase/epimerase
LYLKDCFSDTLSEGLKSAMNTRSLATNAIGRRSLLTGGMSLIAARTLHSGVPSFKLAMCNETFEGRSFADTCKSIRKAGYTGVEVAPFTLSDDPNRIPRDKRREYASIIKSEGLTYAGLHWLLLAPKGLHVTSRDQALRIRSWEHLRQLIDLSADLGPGGVMVFGSPQQRGVTAGLRREEAVKHFVDGLSSVAPHAAERDVLILVETFAGRADDIATTMAEAAAMVRQIGSPAIQTMFDTGNTAKEQESAATLVDRYFAMIHHIHIRGTNSGSYDYKPVLGVLQRRGYKKWISLEAFNVRPEDADGIAHDTFELIQMEIAGLTGAKAPAH